MSNQKQLLRLVLAGAFVLTSFGCTGGIDALNLPLDFGDADVNDGPTDGAATNDDGDDAPNDATDDAADDVTNDSFARTVRGVIAAIDGAGKPRARTAEQDGGYAVLVQSTATGETYRNTPDPNGPFAVEIPDDEPGDTFMVTILAPDGKPVGPVVFATDGDEGLTGLRLEGDADLGAIGVPTDPNAAALAPGDDADLGLSTPADDVTARLNDAGAPVGAGTFGRGDAARGDVVDDPNQMLDKDRDGLVDTFDADDDGDGTIDDFDDDADLDPWLPDGLTLNFFMNLKVDDVTAGAFFSGDIPGIETVLKTGTLVTFEVRCDPSVLGKGVSSARIIAPPAPAPPYLPMMTVMGGGPWSASSYALRPDGVDHFQEWATPNDFMNTGDTFTAEITFDDGTVGVYSRMINYVFKSIPKLLNVGPPGALAFFDGPKVIEFDGTQDLAFEWNPPVDDFGMLMVGLPYFFEVFYYDASGVQINNIDGAATWPTPIADWETDRQVYVVDGSLLTTLSASNTFTVTLPKEVFVDTVQTSTGPVDVGSYKVDIAAQKNGNNAALMVQLEKL